MFTESDKEATKTLIKYWKVGANSQWAATLTEDPTNIFIKYHDYFKIDDTKTKSWRGKAYPIQWTGPLAKSRKDFTWQVNDKSADGKNHATNASAKPLMARDMAWSSAFITYCMRFDPTFEQGGFLQKVNNKWSELNRGLHGSYVYAGMINTVKLLLGQPTGYAWYTIFQPLNANGGPHDKNATFKEIFRRMSKYVTFRGNRYSKGKLTKTLGGSGDIGVQTGDIAIMLTEIHGKPGSPHGDIVCLGEKDMKNMSYSIPERWLNLIAYDTKKSFPPRAGKHPLRPKKKNSKETKKEKKGKASAKAEKKAAAKEAEAKKPSATAPASPPAGTFYSDIVNVTDPAAQKRVDAVEKKANRKFSDAEIGIMRKKIIDEKKVIRIGGNVSGGGGHSGGSPGCCGMTVKATSMIFSRRKKVVDAIKAGAAHLSADDRAYFEKVLERFKLEVFKGPPFPKPFKRHFDINGNKIGTPPAKEDPATEVKDPPETAKSDKKGPKRKKKPEPKPKPEPKK